MDFVTIRAQLAKLTSQLSLIAERTSKQSVPTFGYPTYQQGWESDNTWNDHSNYTWWESQQFQQEAYWQPYEEFYQRPCAPTQPQPQPAQTNSGTSLYNDTLVKLLTNLSQGQENQNQAIQYQDKRVDHLEKRIGQIAEFVGQIQKQSELSNSNSTEYFEIDEPITLESGVDVGDEPKTSQTSLSMNEQLLLEEEEDEKATAREEPLLPQPTLAPLPWPQPPNAPPLSNTGKLGPIFVNSNPIPPNVPFPRRFLIPKQEESEKDIVEALPKVQNDIPILGATKQVLDCVEYFKGLCTPRRMIQEEVVAGEYVECIKEDVLATTKPNEVEFYDTGQVTTLKPPNLAELSNPKSFEVVFVLESVLEHKASKPSSLISISFSINMLLILMIQAPNLEFKPLPDHFKYHLPFKEVPFHAMVSNEA